MSHYRKTEASRYRAIETRIWEICGGLDSDSFKLFLYLWFGPHSTYFGIVRVKDAYILDDLHWTTARLRKAWKVLADADLVWRDHDLAVVVPFLQSNPPANENIVKGWRKQVALLPDSPLFGKLYQKVLAWVTDEGLAWLKDKCPKPSPNGSETVLELRVQVSGPRAQVPDPRSREKGTGEVPEGERGGPDRYPLPPQPCPAPTDVSSGNSLDTTASRDRNGSSHNSHLVQLFKIYGPDVARRNARKQGYAEPEIDKAERAVAREPFLTPGTAEANKQEAADAQ